MAVPLLHHVPSLSIATVRHPNYSSFAETAILTSLLPWIHLSSFILLDTQMIHSLPRHMIIASLEISSALRLRDNPLEPGFFSS